MYNLIFNINLYTLYMRLIACYMFFAHYSHSAFLRTERRCELVNLSMTQQEILHFSLEYVLEMQVNFKFYYF
jgi:hypothetical protein